MNNFLLNLPHLIMAVIVIAAVTILAATGVIPGNTALVVIAGAGGVSLGVGAASSTVTLPATTPDVPAAPVVPVALVTPPAA